MSSRLITERTYPIKGDSAISSHFITTYRREFIAACIAATAVISCGCQNNGSGNDGGGNDGGNANGVADVPGNFFVNNAVGSDGNTGRQASPFASIQRGLDAAEDFGTGNVYVAGGVYSESIQLKSLVNLFGSYNPSNWQRDVNVFPTTISGGTTAVTANGVDMATVEAFRILSTDADNQSASSITVKLIGSTAITLNENMITAGDGANGDDGRDGLVASGGAHGRSGLDAGGCPPDRTGGIGPMAMWSSSNHPIFGEVTIDFSGGTGGTGGVGGGFSGDAGGGYEGVGPDQVSLPGGTAGTGGAIGVDGGPGGDGMAGMDGSNGEPGMAFGRVIDDGDYIPSDGTRAPDDALPGTGGGGGGGGGGALVFACGGGGGSGASGGFQGDPGGGGGGGGASIAILLTNASQADITNNTIETGDGGDGGDSGLGSAGGVGGSGGLGGTRSGAQGAGGPGGNGGDGGDAGDGGAGGGGPSIGIIADDDSTFTQTGNTFNLGDAGIGGAGEGELGGEDGEQAQTKEIQVATTQPT
jgi:hypothetical protein